MGNGFWTSPLVVNPYRNKAFFHFKISGQIPYMQNLSRFLNKIWYCNENWIRNKKKKKKTLWHHDRNWLRHIHFFQILYDLQRFEFQILTEYNIISVEIWNQKSCYLTQKNLRLFVFGPISYISKDADKH